MKRHHPFPQIVRDIADGRELDVASLPGGVEVGNLRDGTATKNAEA